MMFFTAGNVRESFGTLRMRRIHGMARSVPWTSASLVVGTLAIAGLPPFGLFISEFMILSAAFSASRYFIAILLMVALSVVFGALLHNFQRMLAGKRAEEPAKLKLQFSDFAAMGVCTALLLALGVRIPDIFANLLQRAMVVLQ